MEGSQILARRSIKDVFPKVRNVVERCVFERGQHLKGVVFSVNCQDIIEVGKDYRAHTKIRFVNTGHDRRNHDLQCASIWRVARRSGSSYIDQPSSVRPGWSMTGMVAQTGMCFP